MKYVVIVRRLLKGKTWNQLQYEFNTRDAAEVKAHEWYDNFDTSHGEEITVLVYELIESLN